MLYLCSSTMLVLKMNDFGADLPLTEFKTLSRVVNHRILYICFYFGLFVAGAILYHFAGI